MDQNWAPPPALAADALLAQARLGGPEAALAAKRAAILAESARPALAREALALAVRLDPTDSDARLGLARMHAEANDLEAAAEQASLVLKEAVDQGARARAAFIIAEIARVKGEPDIARAHYGLVMSIEERLLAIDRSDPTASRWYARARGRVAELDATAGQTRSARSGAEGALGMLRAIAAHIGEEPMLAADIADAEMRLAQLELDAGEALSARRRAGEAIGRYEALAVTEAQEPHWRSVLADCWRLAAEADFSRGAKDRARESIDKSLQARLRLAARHSEEAPALAGTWRMRAALLFMLGDNEGAAQSLAQARALAEQMCRNAIDSATRARFLVHTLLEQSDLALQTGALPIALDAADSARALAEQRAQAEPWFSETAACWDRLAQIARAANDAQRMRDALERAVAFRRMALKAAPDDEQAQRGIAAALVRFGEASLDAGGNSKARSAFEESAALRLNLAEAAPDDPRTALALAGALERLGLAALAAGDTGGARAAWENELALAEKIYPDDDNDQGVRFRAIVHAHLVNAGGLAAELHRSEAARLFDLLAGAGALTQNEAALRERLRTA